MAIIYDEPPENPDPPPPLPDALPGLAQWLRRRYTSNFAVSEDTKINDLLYETVFPAARMFITQGFDGRIRLHNKKPVDWALATASFPIGDTVLDVDDVGPWISNQKYFLLIAPHTVYSEIRQVTDGNYSTGQNSITLTTSHTGSAFAVGAFSGCDGNNTPATGYVQVNSFSPGTTYTVTLDTIAVQFTPSAGDDTGSIASFLAGVFARHPKIFRRIKVEWDGANRVNLTGRFGTLTINTGLTNLHAAPVTNPATAPTLAAAASGTLAAGAYRVAYAFRNVYGRTLLSPYKSVTVTANQRIQVSAVSPPAGSTVVWYVTPEAGSSKLRYHSENNGGTFYINRLPKLSASLPPDLNRTGAEVMRVSFVFSDREEVRSATTASNVLRASYEWLLGNRQKSVNRIDLKYREAAEDFRLKEIRIRDDAHIAKVKKIENEEVNGQAIDNYFQAYRIASGELAEKRDADFFYKWGTVARGAALIEEGDVGVITDNGSGVINLPVMIEAVELDPSSAGLPKLSFTARRFANTLYDDAPNEVNLPVLTEITVGGDVTPPSIPTSLTATPNSDTQITLGFTASTDNVAVTGYEYRIDGGSAVDFGNVVSYAVTGLSPSTTYSFQVRAYDAAGNRSAWCDTVSGTTFGNTAPTFTSVAYDTPNSEVDLVFAKNGTATGNIQVEYKLTTDLTWTTHATEFAHGATSGSVVITEQPTAKTYDIRLTQVGVSGYSTVRQVTVDADTSGGTAPSDLSALADETGGPGSCDWTIDLTWTAGSGSGNFTVERRLGLGGSWVVLSTLVASTSYSDNPPVSSTSNRSYYYRVKRNSTGLYSNTASAVINRCLF